MTDDTARAAAGSRAGSDRAWALVTRALVALVVLLIPLRVLWLGWQPPDDALRHAAKAVSGREWADVIVLRPGVAPDSHPGWHAVLSAVHGATGLGAPELVALSVLALSLAVLLPGVLLLERPEAWLLALLVPALTDPSTLIRLEAGRPFLLSAALVVALCLLYPGHPRRLGARAFAAVTVALAVLAWIHPSWYLFALLPLACLLAGRGWLAAQLAVSLGLGVLLAAAASGHPIGFVYESLRHPALAFRDVGGTWPVIEFRPQIAPPELLLAGLALLGWRALRGRWTRTVVANPVFALAVLGWVLGLAVRRFWLDWGFPAALVWFAFEIQDALAEHEWSPSGRLRLAVAASLPLLLAATNDFDGRFTTRDRTLDCLAGQREGEALPAAGGVLYSNHMQFFYQLFYRMPQARFRYALGYEPGLMLPDDLAVYRRLQRGESAAYSGWAARMRPQDRLLVVASSPAQLPEVGLDWSLACGSVWSGRTPRSAAPGGE